MISVWNGHRLTNKSYSRDNRLIIHDSPYRLNRLIPRCRLFLSRFRNISQGFGCSPNKKEHELGLVRRETVRILSSNGKIIKLKLIVVRKDTIKLIYGKCHIMILATLIINNY